MSQAVAGLGGNGLGQVLVAVGATLLVRLFSGPGPVLLPDNGYSSDDDEEKDAAGDADDSGETHVPDKVFPVSIRWSNISCSLTDKSSKSVNLFYFLFHFEIFFIFIF